MLTLVIGGAAAGILVGGAAYGSMAPGSQLFGRTFWRGSDDRQVALTYDDGPNDPETLKLLELLTRRSATATFFLVGKHVRSRPDIVREILKLGHTVGNHSFSHPCLLWMAYRKVWQELDQCQKAIEDTSGYSPLLFRPPFGLRRPGVLFIARELNLRPVMWSATCFDWKPTTKESIFTLASRDIDKTGFGSVVLLHDGDHRGMGANRSQTIGATEMLLEKYAHRGYRFVSVGEMVRSPL